MESERTVREFVEDLLSNGRTGREIIAVAQNTYWKPRLEEVRQVVLSFSKIFKKKYSSF